MLDRPRRMRQNAILRDFAAETTLSTKDFIYPIFVREGKGVKEEIASMPGQYRFSPDTLKEELKAVEKAGVKGVLLFGIPDQRDACGSSSYAKDGVVQRAIAEIKSSSDVMVITDVCLCEYTDHGHCGLLDKNGGVDNDRTLDVLALEALSHAEAGADMVAPSDMMDGRVLAIRNCLDGNGFSQLPIMAYSAKYASAYYGPFRDAAQSTPGKGDRKSYQMDCRNRREALHEVDLDLEEGADIVMVKPALAYLDILREVRNRVDKPVAAYSVSGEYTMVRIGIDQGFLAKDIIYENHIAIKRAGADIIISYFAKEIREILEENHV